jgi:hypothetical protein
MNGHPLRVAVSGHRGLSAGTALLIDRELRLAVAAHAPDVVGLSCLADGADQIFARVITDLGGELEVVVPAGLYRDGLQSRRGLTMTPCWPER